MIVAMVRANCKCKPIRLVLGPHGDGCPLVDVAVDTAWYTVTREGTPKRDGGNGVRWNCTCNEGSYKEGAPSPDHVRAERAPLTCRHLRALFAGNVLEVEDRESATGSTLKSGGYYAILTPDGIDLLKPTWAVRALKEAGEAR